MLNGEELAEVILSRENPGFTITGWGIFHDKPRPNPDQTQTKPRPSPDQTQGKRSYFMDLRWVWSGYNMYIIWLHL